MTRFSKFAALLLLCIACMTGAYAQEQKHAMGSKIKQPPARQLYAEVACGNVAQRSIDTNSQPDYRQKLEEELREMRETEMWQAGAVVRKLRPENN